MSWGCDLYKYFCPSFSCESETLPLFSPLLASYSFKFLQHSKHFTLNPCLQFTLSFPTIGETEKLVAAALGKNLFQLPGARFPNCPLAEFTSQRDIYNGEKALDIFLQWLLFFSPARATRVQANHEKLGGFLEGKSMKVRGLPKTVAPRRLPPSP